MLQFIQYYGQFQGFRGRVSTLPGWGRFLLVIAAIPGLVLLALSILVFGVSLTALLLLTVPVYRLVTFLGGANQPRREVVVGEEVDEQVVIDAAPAGASAPPSGRRHVEVKIVD
jgi:hypothetical protein